MIHISGKMGYIRFDNKYFVMHRLNGFSIMYDNYEAWYKDGRLHRIGGPATIEGDYKSWYIEGVYYNEFLYHKKLKEMGL